MTKTQSTKPETVRIGDAVYSRICGDNQGRPFVTVTYDDGDCFMTYYVGQDVRGAWAEVDIFGRQLTEADV